MPNTGWDPPQHGDPTDVSGGGLDPSAYYALSPGGRFPGDLWFYLEQLAAADPGVGRTDPAAPKPDYTAPGWLKNLPGAGGKLAAFLAKLHERGVRAGGLGPVSDPLSPNPYTGYSGPGAVYGPAGGPLHGLLDQGNPSILDDVGYPPQAANDTGPPAVEGGGGGGGGGKALEWDFQPTQGMTYKPQFVGWEPTAPFTVGTHSAGKSSLTPAKLPPPPKGKKPPKKPKQPAGGAPPGPGPRPGVRPPPGGGGIPLPFDPGVGEPLPRDDSDAALARELMAILDPGGTGLPRELLALIKPDMSGLREGDPADMSQIFKGTPGWVYDPTLSNEPGGFPFATPRGQLPGEHDDDYTAYLHDRGFSNESIYGIMNGWGTGPVVSGPQGGDYHFANTGTPTWGSSGSFPGQAAGDGRPSNAAGGGHTDPNQRMLISPFPFI